MIRDNIAINGEGGKRFAIPRQTKKHRQRLIAAARRSAIQAKWRREAKERANVNT